MPRLQKSLMLTDKGYRDLKAGIVACTVTNFAMMLPFMVSIQMFAELIKPFMGQAVSWNKMWLLFGGGLIGAGCIFFASKNDYKKTYITSYMEAENTRISIAEQVRRLPMSVFNEKAATDLTTSIMGDVTSTEHVLSHLIPQLVANGISITLICVMMSFFNWRMALAMFITMPLAFGIIYFSRKIQTRLGQKHAQAKLDASDKVQEYLEGIKVIRACNLDGEKFAVLEDALRKMRDLALKFEFGAGVFVTSAQVVLQAGVGLTVFAGVQLLSEGQIELLPMLMFLLIVTRIYGPVLVELTLLPELFYNQIAVGRLRTLMEYPLMTGSAETPLTDFEVTLDHVDFRYHQGGEKVIRNFSATIAPESITAFVGPSGSGKSTIARLIARFWDVESGTVRIGPEPVTNLNPEHLMQSMSFVFQDVTLFNDTIFNNIKIGNLQASDEEVYEAAKAACVDEFAEKLPAGYDTLLGENGSTLSGGQRQRLSIARALLKDAPIVLLDEATASLDPENEMLIQQAISRLISAKTVVVIAHRLRTIAEADKIIVLEHGQKVEEGSHAELMARRGLYHKLFTIQKEAQEWQI